MKPGFVYLNGEIIPESVAKISVNDRGFLFADGVYEVICSYDGNLFYPGEHIKRLKRSLKEVSIRYNVVDNLINVGTSLLTKNDLIKGKALIYMQITRGTYVRMHRFPDQPVPPTVFINTSKMPDITQEKQSGINAILTPDIRWSRCDIKSVSLLPNVLCNQKAIDNNAKEAIFVRDGAITEGTHNNVFGAKDGVLYTFPNSNYILPGITREIVTRLANKINIEVRTEPIFEDKIFTFDEIFISGTSKEITPVISLDGKMISGGKPGEITKKLQHEFDKLHV